MNKLVPRLWDIKSVINSFRYCRLSCESVRAVLVVKWLKPHAQNSLACLSEQQISAATIEATSEKHADFPKTRLARKLVSVKYSSPLRRWRQFDRTQRVDRTDREKNLPRPRREYFFRWSILLIKKLEFSRKVFSPSIGIQIFSLAYEAQSFVRRGTFQ